MFLSDIKYGLRLAMRSPQFSLTVVLVLALGIGANTAIFSVVQAVLLDPLHYPDAGGLVMAWERSPRGSERNPVAAANFLEWQSRTRSLQQLAALHILPVNLTGEQGAEQVWALRASPSLFPMLGMNAALGRGLAEGEDRAPGARTVVLTRGLWRRRFGGRGDVVGRTLIINDAPFTIVGVMPHDFELPPLLGANAELIVPLAFAETDVRRGGRFLAVIGRIRPGLSLAAARADMDTAAAQMARDFPDRNAGWGVTLVPLTEQLVGELRPAILVLLAAVGCVLLIACANVANLLLARAAGRQKEIAIRAALGASRAAVLRQLLTESVLLALSGGAIGLLLAVAAVRALAGLSPVVAIQRFRNVEVNLAVLAFTLVLSVGTGLLFGLAPALSSLKADVVAVIKSGGRTSSAAAGRRVRGYLVVAEVAIALMLLIAGGLMLRTFSSLMRVDPGFRADHVLTMRIMLTPLKYMQQGQRLAFYRAAIDGFSALPGVESAAAVSFLPLTGVRSLVRYSAPGRPAVSPEARPTGDFRTVTPEYFRVMGIPVFAGRAFDERDTPDSPRAFIVSESLARSVWTGEDPLGRSLRIDDTNAVGQVIGVVRDAHYRALSEQSDKTVYMSYAQNPLPFASFAVRTTSNPATMAAAAMRQIAAIDRDQPISDLCTLDEIVGASTARTRAILAILSLFALAAGFLAAVGVYGVMSCSVAQQMQEFGVRVAIGAQPGDIVRQVVKQGVVLGAAGVVIGTVGALAVTRAMSTLLFGVRPSDPATYAGVAALLIAAAVIASYLPARRAGKVDPSIALRGE